MPALKEIYSKPIDRPIDGVIKADDDASLRVELEEYVITGEIATKLEGFLEAYNNYDTANGVWISGFFGSGKSHLLKMLATLLENQNVDGNPAMSYFEDKLAGIPMLAGGLRKASAIPSKSILFNIDQKADVISKTDIDALLSVFQKVFDEMCGYYGKQPHIAQFERDLDTRGQLDSFKAAFESHSSKTWERGREQALLEKSNIAKAYADVSGGKPEDASDILTQYRKDTKVSIEDFANTVKAWIENQEPNFRLNFFVDEIGQYIADNVKLMTNLQTVAESLNTKCKGQAWIIVTSQQDMASVVGDMTAQQENDFSKIMARFANKVPLNSADVAEVIQRRLLSKTDEGEVILGSIFDREENNLKTLFDFTDGSFKYKNFQGKSHFIASYPFPAYQYDLFQSAISGLSTHNAFEGKHSSVGERSMLGVFQEVAKKLADLDVGELATFDLMFEGIRSALKSAVQQSIQIAERNLDDPFAVRVLKILFLVKYVKEFKPTVRNLQILLMDKFNANLTEEKRKIEEALNLLERNTLIQRNGEVYEFLTNEEKDVENEIKSLEVDPSEVSKELETLAFDTIIRNRKIKHLDTGNEYHFSRKLDDHLLGREYELAINIFSPISAGDNSAEAVRMQSMSREELCVYIGADQHFYRDLTLWKKTDKFIRQARSGSSQPGRDRIVSEKGEQNGRRYKELELRLRKLMANAQLFVQGAELEIAGEDPQDRINTGFQVLVDKIFTNLPMLRGVSYSEADITKAAKPESDLFGDGGDTLTEPEQEVLTYIQRQGKIGVRVNAKSLLDEFNTKPYGWTTNAILCLAASLSAKGKVEARSDSQVLEGDKLGADLRNNRLLENILLSPQVEYSAAQIRKIKEMYQEMFDQPCEGTDARSLGAEWSQGLLNLAAEISTLTAQKPSYPFVQDLEPLSEKLSIIKDKPIKWIMEDLPKLEDELLDAKEDILDPIKNFMGGTQKEIYDNVRDFLRDQDANLAYIDGGDTSTLREAITDPKCYKGSKVKGLKESYHSLDEAVQLKLLEERKAVTEAVDQALSQITSLDEFKALTADAQKQVETHGTKHRDGLDLIKDIARLRDIGAGIKDNLKTDLLNEIGKLSAPKPEPTPLKPAEDNGDETPPTPPATPASQKPQVKYVKASDVKPSYAKPYLADAADVDEYINEMKKSLLDEIQKGNKVTV